MTSEEAEQNPMIGREAASASRCWSSFGVLAQSTGHFQFRGRERLMSEQRHYSLLVVVMGLFVVK